MGRVHMPVYGEDLGSAIETAENLIAKIKTNKYDKSDLAELVSVLEEIKAIVEKDEE